MGIRDSSRSQRSASPALLPPPPQVDARAEAERWLRELAAQAERARETARNADNGNGKKGRGNDGDRDDRGRRGRGD
ncbi:hypothetical protein [Blastococcus atacamensis]|uniref:hypothetical protein n=1 Tax=Blastococcus atacamensis TaxID=2070508 RepID=UPI0012FFF859|nr:hypothetical protein [Blastococcus atacamensis]